MIEKKVSTSIGPLRVLLHSPTSGIVFAEAVDPALVNRVVVTFRVDIQPNKNPHSVLPVGAPCAEHVSVSKVGDTTYSWEPSYALRNKVTEVALETFTSLLSDESLVLEVETSKALDTLTRADTALAQAEEVLQQAQAAREAAANEYNRLLSMAPSKV